jgi:hypothetical protein
MTKTAQGLIHSEELDVTFSRLKTSALLMSQLLKDLTQLVFLVILASPLLQDYGRDRA